MLAAMNKKPSAPGDKPAGDMPKDTARAARLDRLAAALRANLRRRKQAQKRETQPPPARAGNDPPSSG
jgi:uncharacterized membrane protein YccC